MKGHRLISIILALLLTFDVIGSTKVSAANNTQGASDIAKPTDIAQVFITTDSEIGKDDYVKASIIIMDAENGSYKTINDTNASVKIRGNSTAGLKKKPYNFKLSSAQSVLGMSKSKKWSLLADYLDTSLMRNKLAYDFAESIQLPYSCETRYVDVWLNGAYQGNYLLVEPIQTGENGIDIDTKNNDYLLELDMGRVEKDVTYVNTYIYRFAIEDPEKITKEQEIGLVNYLMNAETAMKSGDYNEVKKFVNINSFLDFFLLQELFKNKDVNRSSTRFYIKDQMIYAGPVWDMDLTCGNVSSLNSYLDSKAYNNCEDGDECSDEELWATFVDSPSGPYDSWFGLLMKYDEFKTEFYNRYIELQDQIINLYQDNSSGTNQMDQILTAYSNSFARNNEKYPVRSYRGSELYRNTEKTFDESITYLRTWLQNRNLWLSKNLRLKSCKVFFTANGGSVSVKDKVVTKDCYYGILPEPKRRNHTFAGWYTQAEGGTKVTQTDVFTLTHSQRLYAHWNKK